MSAKKSRPTKPKQAAANAIRDRIKEFRRVPASELLANPKNWRTHPDDQRKAVRASLSQVGFADALLARETENGTLELIDGHLRAELTPGETVPVLVLDVSASEADLLLATIDPLAAMATTDTQKLEDLLREIQTGDEDLAAALTALANQNGIAVTDAGADDAENPIVQPVETEYFVQVVCKDEAHQKEIYDRLTGEGLECKLLVF